MRNPRDDERRALERAVMAGDRAAAVRLRALLERDDALVARWFSRLDGFASDGFNIHEVAAMFSGVAPSHDATGLVLTEPYAVMQSGRVFQNGIAAWITPGQLADGSHGGWGAWVGHEIVHVWEQPGTIESWRVTLRDIRESAPRIYHGVPRNRLPAFGGSSFAVPLAVVKLWISFVRAGAIGALENPPEQLPLFRQPELVDPFLLEETCPWCGEEAVLDIHEYWAADRAFMIETCCLASHEYFVEEMQEWTPQAWQAFFAARAGVDVRSVGGDPAKRDALGVFPDEVFTVDQGITLVRSATLEERVAGAAPPGALTLAEIREYVARVHRHAGAAPSALAWGYAIYNGPPSNPSYEGGVPRVARPRKGEPGGWRPVGLERWPSTLIGVAMVGTPVARMAIMRELAEPLLLAGKTPPEVQALLPRKAGKKPVPLRAIERWAADVAAGRVRGRVLDVTRLALNHNLPRFLTHKAASEIYVQAWRDACALGYSAVQTFTLANESGKSLEYARYKRVGTSKGGQADRPSRRRGQRTAELAQAKIRWERRCRRAP